MEQTNIYIAAKKIFPENFDIDHYLGVLFEYEEGAWVHPSNKENDAYSICEQLGQVHLISMRRTPVWNNGSFQGVRTDIMYLKDLNYK